MLKRSRLRREESESEREESDGDIDEDDDEEPGEWSLATTVMLRTTRLVKRALYFVTDSDKFQPPRKRPKYVASYQMFNSFSFKLNSYLNKP